MKNFKNIIIFLGCAVLIVLMTGNATAGTSGHESMAYQLMEKINRARLNIVDTFAANGGDLSNYLNYHSDFPEDPTTGLEKLIPDTRLFGAAALHTKDMVENLYFSSISKNGSSIDDRFVAVGFYSLSSNETLSVVLFQNYLSKENALNALWTAMLNNEMDTQRQTVPILFNPVFKEIGVSVQYGSMVVNSIRLNFYIAVCDYGVDSVSADEKEALFEVNKVRAMPGELTQYIDGDLDTDIILPGDLLPPYAFNKALYMAAKNLVDTAILELNDDIGTENLDPLIQRLFDQDGYAAEKAYEMSKIWITVDEKTTEEVRQHLLPEVITHEINLNPDTSVVFNPMASEIGIAIKSEKVVFDDTEYFVHAMGMVTASPEDSSGIYTVSGSLSIESITSEISTEEELPEVTTSDIEGIMLQITGNEKTINFFSGRNGRFSVKVPPGSYILKAVENNPSVMVPETKLTVAEQNQFLWIECNKTVLP